MNAESMKESDDSESTKDFRVIFGRELLVKGSVSELGLERVDVYSVMVLAQWVSMHKLYGVLSVTHSSPN